MVVATATTTVGASQISRCSDITRLVSASTARLVTVIPTAVGGAGLHIYDWRDCCWFDVETAAPAGVAVVFCGESLAALTAVADKVLRRPLAVASLRWLSVCPV